MTKRRYTLRIIAKDHGRHALMGWVDVDTYTAEVKYATKYGDIDTWRHSHHRGGVVTHHPSPAPEVLDQRYEAGEQLDADRLAISKSPLAMAKWDYRPKAKHTNMIVDAEQLLQFDVWVIKAGRVDLVQEKLDLYPVVVKHELLDDCDPYVLAIAWTFPHSFWDEVGAIASAAS
jgi:hypothetical protein